ncbi:MAG TPA: hypothetical protein DEP47_06110 [Chloroflexi bacterium]|nr:hypothetical protein [Chloroflexota bacterium]
MRSSSIAAGIILILAGLFFLLLPLFPNIASVINIGQHWPLIIVAVGGFFLVGALLGVTGLAIPGTVIAGIGGLLYYQNINNAWESWAYAWALIPGFVGIGIFISRVLEGDLRRGLREGGGLIVISSILFIVFGALLGGGFSFGAVVAILLIVFGLWLFFKALFSSDRSQKT